MASDRVPAHDIMPSGPNDGPKSPSMRRASTKVSSSSGRTQISVNVDTMVHFTCPECKHANSNLRALRFSRRNSFLNQLQCANCQFLQVQLGGSRSPPATRRPNTYTGRGSDDAEPSARLGRPYNASGEKYKPIVSSALASSAHVARSFAIVEADHEAEDGIQATDFQPVTAPNDTNVANHDVDTNVRDYALSASASTERGPPLRRRRKASIFINNRVKQMLDTLPHGLRHKLQPLAGPLERFASQSDVPLTDMQRQQPVPPNTTDMQRQQPVPPNTTDGSTTLPPKRKSFLRFTSARPFSSSPSSAPSHSHHCDCSGRCHCYSNRFGYQQIFRGSLNAVERLIQRNHAPSRSERSLASSPRRPESTNVSQIFPDLRRPNRFSRDSVSLRYPSMLSFGGGTNTERSISRAPERDIYVTETHHAAPQLPNQGAMQNHGATPALAGSAHDSAIHISTPRNSQSLRDDA
jgi:hypothetical protein